jgi:hypothetical protein
VGCARDRDSNRDRNRMTQPSGLVHLIMRPRQE